MQKVFVIGHKNPDTDAIVSVISFTELLRKLNYKAYPYRLGDIQPETKIILEKTRLRIPGLIEDVYPRACDVMTRNVLYIYEDEPLKVAIDTIIEHSIRSLPIIDTKKRVVGIFTIESFAEKFIESIKLEKLELDGTPIKNFIKISGSKMLSGKSTDIFKGYVIVGTVSSKRFRDHLSRIRGNVVVIGKQEKLLMESIQNNASCIIVTEGEEPSREIIDEARKRNIPLLVSPHDAYTTIELLDLSKPIKMFSRPAVTLSEDSLLSDVRDTILRKRIRSIVIVDESGVLQGIITRSDLVKDYRKKVALVDHNEFSQSVDGIEYAEIIAVVDHHRVSGDVKTLRPIIFRIEPLGSTNTIIWKLARELNIEINKNIAEAMLYAILSDTLLLRSPTTTEIDRKIAKEISEFTDVDLSDAIEFTRIAIAASEPGDPERIVTMDLKIFESKIGSFGIAQVMTTRPENYLSMISNLKNTMQKEMKKRNLIFLILMITDYIEEKSFIIAVGDTKTVEYALEIDLSREYAELPKVTSRKSQILPRILRYIEQS